MSLYFLPSVTYNSLVSIYSQDYQVIIYYRWKTISSLATGGSNSTFIDYTTYTGNTSYGLLSMVRLLILFSYFINVHIFIQNISPFWLVKTTRIIGSLHDLITWSTFGKHENSSLLKNFVSTSWKSILKLISMRIFSCVSQK